MDRSEWSRIWGPVRPNTGSFGSDKPCPATQMSDPCPRVAHRRRRLHRDKRKDYWGCAKPVPHPDVPKSLLTVAERGLHQRVCQRVRRRWPGSSKAGAIIQLRCPFCLTDGGGVIALFRTGQHQAEIGNCVGFEFKRFSILNNGVIVFVRHEARIAFTAVALAENRIQSVGLLEIREGVRVSSNHGQDTDRT